MKIWLHALPPRLFLFSSVRLCGAYWRHRLRLARRRGLKASARRVLYAPCVSAPLAFFAARPRVTRHKPENKSSCCKKCNYYQGCSFVLIHCVTPSIIGSTSGHASASKTVSVSSCSSLSIIAYLLQSDLDARLLAVAFTNFKATHLSIVFERKFV